jgi:hypothetical protein
MGSVVHTVISALGRWKQEDFEFVVSLSHVATPCFKNKVHGLVEWLKV